MEHVCSAGSSVPTARVGTEAPTLSEAARRFIERSRSGEAISSWGRPFSPYTSHVYDSRLRRHVLSHADAATGTPLGALPLDQIDAPAVQRLVDDLTRRYGGSIARSCHSALAAVLADARDADGTGAHLPSRSAPSSDRALTVAECRRLVDAARAADGRHDESFFVPLLALQFGAAFTVHGAIRLRWGQAGLIVSPETVRVVVPRIEGGTSQGRLARLPAGCERALRSHAAATAADARSGAPVLTWRGSPLRRPDLVYGMLRDLAAAARIRDFGSLRIRHTALMLDPDQLTAAFALEEIQP